MVDEEIFDLIKKEEKIVNIYNNSTSDLNLTKKILRKDDRKMINIVGKARMMASISSQVSDEKRIKEIDERFEILDEMAASLNNGDNQRALIVTGPPGVWLKLRVLIKTFY